MNYHGMAASEVFAHWQEHEPELMAEWEIIQLTPSKVDDIDFIVRHLGLDHIEAEHFLGLR